MDTNKHPLRTAVLKVLEDWAMMLVDETEVRSTAIFESDEPVFMSWVDLRGDVAGAVSIVAQKSFMQALVTNVLGGDLGDSPSATDCNDAFKEMGNILAGNFLTEAYGENAVFDLLNPTVSEVSFSDVEKFMKRNVVFAFQADNAPVAVTFSIRK